jgi:hypothetical protein
LHETSIFPSSINTDRKREMNVQEPLDATMPTTLRTECGKAVALAAIKAAFDGEADKREDACT